MRRCLLLGLVGIARLAALSQCGDFGLSVDYLYWSNADQFIDAGSVTRPGEGGKTLVSEKLVDPGYSSGVRGELRWRPEWSCLALTGRYSYLEPHQSQRFLNDVPLTQFSAPSITALSVQIPYHAGEILLSAPVSVCDCLQVQLLAGGHLLYWALNTQERIEYPEGRPVPDIGSATFLLQRDLHSRLAGGGPAIGVAANWEIGCGVEAFGELQLGVIRGSYMQAGWIKQDTRGTVALPGPPSTIVEFPRSVQVWTRELDFRLGARLRRSGCWGVAVEAGWESRSYLDLKLSNLFYEGRFDVSPFGRDIGGPFVGIRGGF